MGSVAESSFYWHWWEPTGVMIPFVPPTLMVPGPPLNLTGFGADNGVVLNWIPPLADGGTPITSYQRRRTNDSDVYQAWVTVTGGIVLTETVTGLTNDVTYRFEVRAVNNVGPGAASSEISVQAGLLDLLRWGQSDRLLWNGDYLQWVP